MKSNPSPVMDAYKKELLRKLRGHLCMCKNHNARMTVNWFMYGSKLPKSKGETIKWKRYT